MDDFQITERQREALSVIAKLTKAKGGAGPTHRELAKAMRISHQAAMQMADRLCANGKLRRLPSSARTLKIIEEGPAA